MIRLFFAAAKCEQQDNNIFRSDDSDAFDFGASGPVCGNGNRPNAPSYSAVPGNPVV